MNLFILKQKFRETAEFTSGNIFCKKQNFCEIRIFQKTIFTISSIFQIKYFFSFSRFASGGNGECIQLGEEWMTPNKFEIRAGSKAKKYKVSIKCEQGISIGEYIAKGYLIENATRSKINATDPLNIDGGDSNQLQSKTRSTRSGRKA